MKVKGLRYALLVLLACAVAFSGCKKNKNKDRESPTLSITSPDSDNFTLPSSHVLTIAGKATDDKDLDKLVVKMARTGASEILVQQHISLSGKEQTFSRSMNFSELGYKSGTYDLSIYCTDAAGNSSETKSFVITY